MTLQYYKMLAAFFIFLITVVGASALYPLMKKHTARKHVESLELGEALASGIFLGAAFFHMLPDAIRVFHESYSSYHYPVPEVICIAGFLFMLFLERLSLTFSGIQTKHSIPYILSLILIIHALIEGVALGIRPNLSETIMLFIAIIAHKGSESFALCIMLVKHHLPAKKILGILVFFALMTPLGIFLGNGINELALLGNAEWLEAGFNAFAAGTFLYFSTLHHTHFHEHTDDSQGLLEYASLVAGVSAMAVIAIWT